ncbi:MAG: MBL fold metallo-hydrolase [Halanaeroarchaeum sp.]
MARTLTDDVRWIDLGSVNAYLVDADVLTLVDAGMPWHADDVRSAIRETGADPGDVGRLLVTHYDPDHVGGIPRLALGDVPVHAGERDADLVAGRRRPRLDTWKGFTQRISRVLHDAVEVPVTPVADGDRIGAFEAVHTPGHTRGHTAYVADDLDVAFVGDLVTSDGGDLSPTPWYLSADTDAAAESIARLAERVEGISVVAPGHGEPVTSDGGAALASLAT